MLTLAQVAALTLAGMPLHDAICHAGATLAAGGFSPHPQSLAGYDSAAFDAIVTVFMFAAGANFALQYRALRGGRAAVFRDDELRAYVGIVLVAVAALVVILMSDGMSFSGALRHGSSFRTGPDAATHGRAGRTPALLADL